ncbi:hypothetical protein DEU56DRAFT_916073 [Suillus clintonianus]|uniref:uncharacterized protein n=1 Tax=Suillus clintonianus TaxID=1904413 RepID=UPI001B885F0C|nr:uncharacterized protein DEU56DRAFT_916073 [Suillus clintonianus]KAG2126270.1 hypothetical protein DEU56DRAFT_916073 [Suillus clintonianus]
MSRSDLDCGFPVASFVAVAYDWVLTFGQEVELVWRQRWSLMTFLYLSLRFLGIVTYVIDILGWILYLTWTWTSVVSSAMLGVIMIARLHAMYQRSTRILIFLVVVCLAVNIVDVAVTGMAMRHTSGEEFILSGTYACTTGFSDNYSLLVSMTWILSTVWEVLALCLAVWIAAKHFRELRQHSAGRIVGDCFTVLIKSHMLYFASFVAVSCFNLVYFLSPTISADQNSLENQILLGFLQILTAIQSFVLGPRLILSVREYNARLVADSDAATAMTSIAFQERVHISTGSDV